MNLLLIDRENRQKLQITEKTRKNSLTNMYIYFANMYIYRNTLRDDAALLGEGNI